MPSEEFMKKAGEALYGVPGETINTVRDKLVLARIATALESADASGYARGRVEAVEECVGIADNLADTHDSRTGDRIAAAIRHLSQKDTRHEG